MSEAPNSTGPLQWLSEPAFKWAASFGVTAVFAFFLLWMIYLILFGSLTALSQDIDNKADKDDVTVVGETIKEGFEEAAVQSKETNELLDGICRGIHRTFEEQQKYCNPKP